jgi:hypothetical protein
VTEAETDESGPIASGPERSDAEWPLRPWLLAGLLGLAGLLIHFATDGHDDDPARVALAAFLFFGSIAAAFTLEPGRWKAPSLFALLVGLVMAGLAWRAVRYGENLADEQYGLAAGVVASALALPLFQSGFHQRRLATPYGELHYHVWTDAVSAAGALAFTGLSWIVLAILSELFVLLKIEFLRDLMNEAWFGWTFSGLAAGSALGTVRNQLKVLATMQTVVLLVLSLLAVPLAVGLALFLLATAISGPQVLWEATRSATPTLLACAAGSWVLTCAILRDEDTAMSRSRAMRWAALVLAAVILPLAVFAAFSIGLRLDQYGLAPERLWALVAIVVATAYGIGFWVALARGRKNGWSDSVRRTNFHLALGVCGFALLLALPILDFGAISTRNQLARLERGEVSADDFDYAALRWDFGEPGQRALERMAAGDGRIAELAEIAQKQERRPFRWIEDGRSRTDFELRVQPDDPDLRRLVHDYLKFEPWPCRERCVAIEIGASEDGRREVAIVRDGTFTTVIGPYLSDADDEEEMDQIVARTEQSGATLREDSTVEIRTVERRYIFVDGKPLDQPLD